MMMLVPCCCFSSGDEGDDSDEDEHDARKASDSCVRVFWLILLLADDVDADYVEDDDHDAYHILS